MVGTFRNGWQPYLQFPLRADYVYSHQRLSLAHVVHWDCRRPDVEKLKARGAGIHVERFVSVHHILVLFGYESPSMYPILPLEPVLYLAIKVDGVAR